MLRHLARSLASSLASPAEQAFQSAILQPLDCLPSTSYAPLKSILSSVWGAAQQQNVRSKYTYAFKRAANTPGLVFWKPRTPGLRHKITIDYKALGVYTGPPHDELAMRKKNSGGRNNHGHITVRGRGGGIKKLLRLVDFQPGRALSTLSSATALSAAASTAREGVVERVGFDPNRTGVVERVEFDPNRTGFISLVRYPPVVPGGSSVYKYHLAPDGLRVGDVLHAGPDAPIKPGSTLLLKDIPLGVPIHSIELVPGKGGVIARSAGAGAVIKFKDEKHAVLKLPSGEVRRIPLQCAATIGSVSNALHKLTTMGKAGVNRLRGRRPHVRGIAMNPVDHPHGGRTNGGRPSCTPWGVYCKGTRTRLRNKWTNKLIITRKGGVPIDKFVQAKKWRAAAEREKRMKSGAGLPAQRAGPSDQLLGPRPPAWGVLLPRPQAKLAHA